jgi:hypothetical protein
VRFVLFHNTNAASPPPQRLNNLLNGLEILAACMVTESSRSCVDVDALPYRRLIRIPRLLLLSLGPLAGCSCLIEAKKERATCCCWLAPLVGGIQSAPAGEGMTMTKAPQHVTSPLVSLYIQFFNCSLGRVEIRVRVNSHGA